MVDLKSGNGQAVNATWAIDADGYQGRLVFDRMIVQHTSEKAMKFGRARLKDLCDAVGVKGKLSDLSVLQDKPCLIFVKIEQDEAGEFPPKNVVTRVKPIPAKKKDNGVPIPPDFKFTKKADFDDTIPF